MITKAEITLLSLISQPNEEYQYDDYHEEKTSSSHDSFSDNQDLTEPDADDMAKFDDEVHEDKILLVNGYLRTNKCINHQKQYLNPIDIIPIITTYIDNITVNIDLFLDEMFAEKKINDIISSIVQATSQKTTENIQYVYTQKILSQKHNNKDEQCDDDYKDPYQITSPHHYHRGQYHKNFNENLDLDPFETACYPSPSPDFITSGYQEHDQEIYSTSPEFHPDYSHSPMSYNNTPMTQIFPSHKTYPYHYDIFDTLMNQQCEINASPAPTTTVSIATTTEYEDRKQKDEFANVGVDDIIRVNPTLEDLAVNHLIPRFMIDIAGSRYVQHLLKSKRNPTKYVNFILNALTANETNLAELALDPFANYTVSLLFELADDIQLQFMLESFISDNVRKGESETKPHLLSRLCLSKFGCRVIQTMIRCIKNDQELIKKFIVNFEKYAKHDLHKFLVDRNGNHVIKVLVDLQLPFKYVKSINDVVNNDLVYFSLNEFGCRVVQALIINYGDKIDIFRLMEDSRHLYLSCSQFGNYVIQCILNRTTNDYKINDNDKDDKVDTFQNFKAKFINALFRNKNEIKELSFDKFGSYTIESCIRVSTKYEIDLLISSICKQNGELLNLMITHKFGNNPLKTLLTHCNTAQKEWITTCVHNHIINLYQYDYSNAKRKNNNKNNGRVYGMDFLLSCKRFKHALDHNA